MTMKAITEKTSVRKNMRGLWEGETFTTVNGQTFEITTMKRYNGELVSTAMRIEGAGEGDNFRIVSFSSTDIFQNRTELICRKVRATEKAVREQHAEAVILFDQKAAAGEINGLSEEEPARPEIGTIIFLDGYGKGKGSEGNKHVVYEVLSGNSYKTVELDTLQIGLKDYIKPFSEKFGIGNYFEPDYKFEGTQDELNNIVIEAKQKAKKEQEAREQAKQEAEAERARKIEEGKKLVTIPAGVKSVIVADLYQDDSDIMTDYFSTSVSKRVYLAWSRSDRNNIKELHKAKLNFEDTAELEEEHTRGHSYLPDYFVGSPSWSGWKVHKDKSFFTYNKDASLEALYIAAAEGRFLISEEVKPEPVNVEGVQFIDYSEKAFAIVGDTREIKDELKNLGGRWNSRLSCGAGWIFSKAKSEEAVKEFLNL